MFLDRREALVPLQFAALLEAIRQGIHQPLRRDRGHESQPGLARLAGRLAKGHRQQRTRRHLEGVAVEPDPASIGH
ncbi:MAG: hypothetical protein ACYTFH_04995, partial [Planctomycetota bacterium]